MALHLSGDGSAGYGGYVVICFGILEWNQSLFAGFIGQSLNED